MPLSLSRTDRNNNPAAFTTAIAKQAGLVYNTDYIDGDPFPDPSKLVTAKLVGDPIVLTIRVIDKIGYRTQQGKPRWEYTCLPNWLWKQMTPDQKRDQIGYHYLNEGGTEMKHLFPNYGLS